MQSEIFYFDTIIVNYSDNTEKKCNVRLQSKLRQTEMFSFSEYLLLYLSLYFLLLSGEEINLLVTFI